MTTRALALGIMLVVSSCTRGTTSPPASHAASTSPCLTFVLDRYNGRCVDDLALGGHEYGILCVPVPEVLLDVPLEATWGHRPVRAIAAVPSVHAVAVVAGDRTCGDFALAVRTDLPAETRQAIVAEIRQAGSLPPDLPK